MTESGKDFTSRQPEMFPASKNPRQFLFVILVQMLFGEEGKALEVRRVKG
jgi:hypothetical protein